MILLFFW